MDEESGHYQEEEERGRNEEGNEQQGEDSYQDHGQFEPRSSTEEGKYDSMGRRDQSFHSNQGSFGRDSKNEQPHFREREREREGTGRERERAGRGNYSRGNYSSGYSRREGSFRERERSFERRENYHGPSSSSNRNPNYRPRGGPPSDYQKKPRPSFYKPEQPEQ